MTDPTTVRERIEAEKLEAESSDIYRLRRCVVRICDILADLAAREQAGSGEAEPTRLVSSPKSTRDNSLGATVPPSPAPAVKMPAFGAAIPDSSKYPPSPPAAAGDVVIARIFERQFGPLSPPAPDVARVDYGAIWKEFTRVERGGDSPTGWSGTPFLDLEAMARALSQSRQRAEAAENWNAENVAEAHAFPDDTVLWLETSDGYFDIGLRLSDVRKMTHRDG